MLISGIKYPSINAKLKAMYAKRLNKDDLIELSKQNNLMSIVAVLKNKNSNLKSIDENVDRQEIERLLISEIVIDLEKIVKYLDKNDTKLFQILISKYEINCVKMAIRLIFSKKEFDNNILLWTENIFDNLKGIEKVQNINELYKIIEKTKYKKIFKKYIDDKNENFDIFKIENELDKFYFFNIYESATNRNLKAIIGTEIDFTNIIWIYRMKMYYDFSTDEIKSLLININYKLTKNDIEKLISAVDFDEMNEVLKKTYYFEMVSKDIYELECKIKKYIKKQYKKMFNSNLLSINCIYAYFNLVEMENNDIVSIIESVRYNIDKEKVLKKLI